MHPVTFALVALALQGDSQPARVVIEPAAFEIEVGDTRALRATAYDSAGRALDGARVLWLSNDPAVATVDSTGLVTAHGPGDVRVAARVGRTVGFAAGSVAQLPPATIVVALGVDALPAGTSAPLTTRVRTRLGAVLDDAPVAYESAAPGVASVDAAGRVYGHRPGTATVVARSGAARATIDVRVIANRATRYEITPAGYEVRTGDVVRFRVVPRGASGETVGAVMPAWSVSGSGAEIVAEGGEGVFVAERPGRYRVTALIGDGLARSALVAVTPRADEARLVEVGRGPSADHHSGDMWVFEGVDGRDYVYIGTFMYDWMKVWDVTDPSNPVLTDSVQVDARRINDVKIHPNRRVGVITREGASDRKNGIVLLDLSTPAHPRILSEYTETVTGGVHNVWIRGDANLVYACHNGTSELHIIDVADPRRPKEVGRWGLDRRFKTLHDVIVQDGYAYLSYWDDGVIMLDAGAGTHGGTPTVPTLVSQFAYPVGNTHVAWRHGKYLFVGDEIFPSDWNADRPIEARGYVHVVDYSDPERPVEVARYEVPEAGAHNLWAEGDRLYVGYYQAGVRVVDISGELRGDLYRQGRELAALKTTDARSTVPNWPMAWGAQVYKGHVFSSDLNSGLWVTRLVEERPLP